jgi:hypothetical protein
MQDGFQHAARETDGPPAGADWREDEDLLVERKDVHPRLTINGRWAVLKMPQAFEPAEAEALVRVSREICRLVRTAGMPTLAGSFHVQDRVIVLREAGSRRSRFRISYDGTGSLIEMGLTGTDGSSLDGDRGSRPGF